MAIALCHATVSRFGGLFKVDNMTRTKGNNTQAGNAFQKMLKEEAKQAEKKVARAATKQPKKTASGASAKTVTTKAKAAKTAKTATPSPLRQPQKKLNTAAEIARKIAAQMEE